MIILLCVGIWLVCGFITLGTTVAYFQKEYPNISRETYRSDLSVGLFLAIFGPIGTVITMFTSGFWKHGWRLRPINGD